MVPLLPFPDALMMTLPPFAASVSMAGVALPYRPVLKISRQWACGTGEHVTLATTRLILTCGSWDKAGSRSSVCLASRIEFLCAVSNKVYSEAPASRRADPTCSRAMLCRNDRLESLLLESVHLTDEDRMPTVL